MEYKILEKITSPKDLKNLNSDELNILCGEMRRCIVDIVSKNGGHLSSNLGVVELTVAIHRSFDSPKDAIIFDVGHQCYPHKLLTGRYDRFNTIRKENGISGFMRPDESEHDPFITGHSSNSISAAYGIYKAKCIKCEEGTAVAVIGDGAMTGGMAYEAMNNAGVGKNKFIVVLNDNKMSISKNVGSIARLLTKMRIKPRYHSLKFAVSRLLYKIPAVGPWLANLIYKIKELLKDAVYGGSIFSDMGFVYLGPVNGHDLASLESIFKVAKRYNRPTLIHVITQKGRGYSYAEDSPKDYHGVSPFDVNDGANSTGKTDFSSVAGSTLCDMAEKDEDVCAVTAAMCEGTGLYEFSQRYKSRFFDVGIAEQHAVTFSAGLAIKGLKPYLAVYSSFLQRAYDQILHDAAIANLPIRILVDRAGIVGEDGETHQGIYDVSFLSSIPNMNIYSPCCYRELGELLYRSLGFNELCAIRYPRGSESGSIEADFTDDFTLFGGDKNTCVISYGREFFEVYGAYCETESFDVIKLNKIFPLSDKLIDTLLNYKKIYTFEEAVLSGSISEHIMARLYSAGFKNEFLVNTLPNGFIGSANSKRLIEKYGLDKNSIIKKIKG